jgi:hypothetical protein
MAFGSDANDRKESKSSAVGLGIHEIVPITGTIGTNPLDQFADWKLARDKAGLKGEACLLQKELIRKDAFAYQLASVAIILDRNALEIQTWIRIMPITECRRWGVAIHVTSMGSSKLSGG